MLRPLIQQYGVQAVERAGLAANEFPAGWVRTYEEARNIQDFLEEPGVRNDGT